MKLRSYKYIPVFISLLICSCLSGQQVHPNLKWKLFPQDETTQDGKKISMPGFVCPPSVEAIVPGTVFYAYVKAGKEKDPDYADNIYQVDHKKYNQPYWYRTEFVIPSKTDKKTIWLNLKGVNKVADIFLNGQSLGTLKGLMERGKYNITTLLNKNKPNILAIRISPPLDDPEHNHRLANWECPTYLCSAGWDWMPAVPGLNSGLTDSVTITATGSVIIQDPWVTAELPTLDQAYLSIRVNLRNTLSAPVSGNLKAIIHPGNIEVNLQQIQLAATSEQTILLDATQYPQLTLSHPILWWPNGYGGNKDGTQSLYKLTVQFRTNGKEVSDEVSKTFGIRKVTMDTTSLNGPMRVYINNLPVLLKGGNWGMSDYMLKVRGKDYEPRIRFHKEMNYNVIRNWTGEVTDEEFYDYCDQYGIMVWDDFWLNNFGPIDSLSIFKRNAIEKVKRLRNHPSIVIWCGANEGVPGGDPQGSLNMAIKNAVLDNDANQRIYIARSNAGEKNPNFSIQGSSKNLSGSGIWGNVDPRTYFTDPHNGYLFSNNSYGMRSELGTATFVNVESLKKFMPEAYWVPPTVEAVKSNSNLWAKHFFCTDGALGGGSDPVRYINDINNRYGSSVTIEDFCKKAQLMNLETLKAMYEAWNDHLWNDASGMLIWMSQSAYPTMIWQTYDYYLDLTGAYFGSKMACEPVHIQWNPATQAIKVINNLPTHLDQLTAEAEIFNISGKSVPGSKQQTELNMQAASVKEVFRLALEDSITQKLSAVYFLKLTLQDKQGKIWSENLYWIGKNYLDYHDLNNLPEIKSLLKISSPSLTDAEIPGHKIITYTLTNTSDKAPAFGVRAQLTDKKGNQILPCILNDGYFTLMQQESKILQIEVDQTLIQKGFILKLTPYNDKP